MVGFEARSRNKTRRSDQQRVSSLVLTAHSLKGVVKGLVQG